MRGLRAREADKQAKTSIHWLLGGAFCNLHLIILRLLATAILMTAAMEASAQTGTRPAATATPLSVDIDSVTFLRRGDSVDVAFNIIGPTVVADNIIVAPRICGLADTLALPGVAIMGRQAWYRYRRGALDTDAARVIWEKDLRRDPRKPGTGRYAVTVPYHEWMDRATLAVGDRQCDACGDPVAPAADSTCTTPRYTLHIEDGIHERNVESRSGRAYIDFRVNKTNILPDYHDNRRELRKIRAAVDSACADTTIRIVSLTIKGYASPEGPYDNNVRLARERSQKLRDYIAARACIPDSIIVSDYEPEDWQGLREWVAKSNLTHRAEILDIIDNDTTADLDAKLLKIRHVSEADYRTLGAECFPWLRHSDYRIAYQRITTFDQEGRTDTLWAMPQGLRPVAPMPAEPQPTAPLYALKTNLLFDAALAPNVEVEVPFGRDREWSVMGEVWFPWDVWHHNSRAYEILTIGLELRRWLGSCRPLLTGTFVGLYAAGGKYDLEWSSVGDQGEFTSLGATFGHSWAISSRLNIEASVSAGFYGGPRRHYHGEFSDTHLIWKRNAHDTYVGPTKAKISLVWLLDWPFRKGKGGIR